MKSFSQVLLSSLSSLKLAWNNIHRRKGRCTRHEAEYLLLLVNGRRDALLEGSFVKHGGVNAWNRQIPASDDVGCAKDRRRKHKTHKDVAAI